MGFRFRKSVNFGPFRLNFSKSGIGYSFGVKGARVTKKANGGTRVTASVPGTGLSYVKETGAKASGSSSGSGALAPILASAATVLVLVFGIVGCTSSSSEAPQPESPASGTAAVTQSKADEEPEPVDFGYISEYFSAVVDGAMVEVINDQGKPCVSVLTDFNAEDEPAEWAAICSRLEQGLVSAGPAAEENGAKTVTAQIIAANGDILASGYNESLHYDAYAVKPEPETQPEPESAPQVNEKKVYRTKSGKRYHCSDSCNGGTYYETTLSEALDRGLTPCEKCVG